LAEDEGGGVSTERREKLLKFLSFLKKRANFAFNKDNFEHRIKLQKYVYIARFCGLDLGYKFGMYLRGPYSPELADDYYKISYSVSEPASLSGFDSEKFLKTVKNRDARWLEIAATILSVRENNRDIDDESVTRIVSEIKNTDESRVKEILSHLRSAMD